MRILHVIYIPRYSGAEILVRDLAFLHLEEGNTIGVCSLFPPEQDFMVEIERMEGCGIKWFMPATPLGKLGRIRHLRRWFAEFQPDVIVAHSVIPSAYARIATISGSDAPVVSVLHDSGENEYSVGMNRLSELFLSSRAAAIAAVSKRAIDNYRRNVRSHPRMVHIPNGVRIADFNREAQSRAAHRASFGLTEDELIILQVGRINGAKRQLESIKAVMKMAAELPHMKFWMAGILESPEYIDQVKRLIESSRPDGRIKLLGGRSDIAQLLAACDLFVMPSHSEAHSVALLEAIASGAPIIASNIAPFAFAESIEGVTLLDPTDTTSYAAAMQRELSARRRYVRDLSAYGIDATARAYLELFQSF
jgi:L-malate glycosyltransferase